jgi:hypothetical protein
MHTNGISVWEETLLWTIFYILYNPQEYTGYCMEPWAVPVAVRPKAWFCGRSHAEIVGSNPAETWMFVFVKLVCFQVEVSVMS